MARQRRPEWEVTASKRRKVRTRDRYNITSSEERRLMADVPENSASRGYGMSARMIDALIDRHRNGNAAMKRVIEEQLDDINYHTESRLLSQGKYRDALRGNKTYHAEMGTKPSARYAAQYGLIAG